MRAGCRRRGKGRRRDARGRNRTKRERSRRPGEEERGPEEKEVEAECWSVSDVEFRFDPGEGRLIEGEKRSCRRSGRSLSSLSQKDRDLDRTLLT